MTRNRSLFSASSAFLDIHSLFSSSYSVPEIQHHTCRAQVFPRIPGIDYCGECWRTSHTRCDFLGFVPLEQRGLLIFIGDVEGTGIGAHIIAAGLENMVRSQANGDLQHLVRGMNRSLCDISNESLYVTLFCALADPAKRQLHYVSAGHGPVLLFNQQFGRLRRLENTATVMGLTSRSVFQQHTMSIQPADVLVAFTEGVTEARDPQGREFREAGVLRVLWQHSIAGATELSDAIMTAVRRFGGESLAGYDRAVAVARFQDAGTQEPLRCQTEAFVTVAA
jgi:phosphoserine phosphatase RsbU/P